MKVLRSRLLSHFPGLQHGTATLEFQPLTFRGHKRGEVIRARQKFLSTLGVPLETLTLGRQVHGTRLQVVLPATAGRGAFGPNYLNNTDALLAQSPGIALGVFTADCIPVLLYDPVTGWIGAIHAGWRGIEKRIIPKAIAELAKHKIDVTRLHVWLGPSICAGCYVTTDKKRAKVITRITGRHFAAEAKQWHLDLRGAAKRQLVSSGVVSKHIEVSTVCTKTSHQLPSARRQGPAHPNTLSVIYRSSTPTDLRGKRVVVFGLGVLGGGVESARFALAQHAQVHVVDAQTSRQLHPSLQKLRGLGIAYSLGAKVAQPLPPADLVIANPGIPPTHPALKAARKDGVRITNDLALFRERSTNPLIAITGTKGKTTVATWLAFLLRKQKPILAGNLQHSPLAEPDAFCGKRPVVLEVSSFQLEHCDVPLRPELSVITNLYPDHLNRHGTMRAYAKVKGKLFANARGPVIVPRDSEWRRYATKIGTQNVFWTSARKDSRANAWLEDGSIMVRVGKKAIRVIGIAELRSQDQAFVRNAVTVVLAAHLYGLTMANIRKGLRAFPGVPQRFEKVRVFKQRTFINSTTATNPIAALTALQSVRGRCIVLAGGSSKKLPMVAFAKELNNRKAPVILFSGSATASLARLLKRAVVVKSMRQAVRMAWRLSRPNDTILLAPGAASFGMFRNEFDRGLQFVRNVRALR